MRIAMVSSNEFPPDPRIEKEALALENGGHEVFICTPVAGSCESQDHFKTVELGERVSTKSALRGRLTRVLRVLQADVIHIQDTPAALPAVLSSRMLRVPVVFDIHEIWPSLVLEDFAQPSYREVLWSKSLAASEIAGWLSAKLVFTVVEEASRYFISKYNFSTRNVTSIRNFESLGRFNGVEPDPEMTDDAAYKVTYVGNIDGTVRGLEDVLHAARILAEERIRFIIVGEGAHRSYLRHLCRSLRLDETVLFMGKRSFRQAMSIVAGSDLCLLPHRSCLSTELTLPHKISQYMAVQKPVVSSNLHPIQRLFGGGYVGWAPRTPERLAEIIVQLKEDPQLARDVAGRGFEIVRDRCRWEGEARRLVVAYESIAAS